MKTIIFVCMIFALSYLSHSFAGDHPSVHGMVIFGNEKVYLSHLPMFHDPHDYQVVAEASLDPAALKAYTEFRSHHPYDLMTIVPEPFVLPDMVAKPKSFKAQLYAGHFERGGKVLVETVTMSFSKIIYFSKLSDNPLPKKNHGYGFGTQTEKFFLHLISGRGDHDQIALVKIPRFFNPIVLKDEGLKPLEKGVFETNSTDLEVVKSLYLEFGDLAH